MAAERFPEIWRSVVIAAIFTKAPTLPVEIGKPESWFRCFIHAVTNGRDISLGMDRYSSAARPSVE